MAHRRRKKHRFFPCRKTSGALGRDSFRGCEREAVPRKPPGAHRLTKVAKKKTFIAARRTCSDFLSFSTRGGHLDELLGADQHQTHPKTNTQTMKHTHTHTVIYKYMLHSYDPALAPLPSRRWHRSIDRTMPGTKLAHVIPLSPPPLAPPAPPPSPPPACSRSSPTLSPRRRPTEDDSPSVSWCPKKRVQISAVHACNRNQANCAVRTTRGEGHDAPVTEGDDRHRTLNEELARVGVLSKCKNQTRTGEQRCGIDQLEPIWTPSESPSTKVALSAPSAQPPEVKTPTT